MKEARLYQSLDDGSVRCRTCAHGCRIRPRKRGLCGVMENQDGKLISLVYGKPIALHEDPIEKKPLFHFHPGSMSFSVATVGCNMICRNCQNAEISQMPKNRNRIQGEAVPPDALVTLALQAGCASISYTYTEPSVFWDYAYDTARSARDKGLKNVFVTNGYFSQESLEAIAPFMDAANVDLKAFRDSTYKENCGARLEPVLETIRRMRALGVWVEVTTLLIPGLNDSDGELKDIADFVFGVDPDMPWHVSRFYPTYRLSDCPPTPPDAVRKARDIGLRAGLRFVYTGNMPGDEGERTVCWNCKTPLVERLGFQVRKNRIIEGKCIQCGVQIAGVWG